MYLPIAPVGNGMQPFTGCEAVVLSFPVTMPWAVAIVLVALGTPSSFSYLTACLISCGPIVIVQFTV
jgi:hypothetical protein